MCLCPASQHESWYCKSEESFLTETQVHDVIGPDGVKRKVSISTGHPVVWLQEPNYKFKCETRRVCHVLALRILPLSLSICRLMDSQSALLKWLQECPDAIIPQSRYKEVCSHNSASMWCNIMRHTNSCC